MPVTPGEPLTKVTLNLYTEDLEFLKRFFSYGYSTEIREIVHDFVLKKKRGWSNVYGG